MEYAATVPLQPPQRPKQQRRPRRRLRRRRRLGGGGGSFELPAALVHRIDAFDCLRLCLRTPEGLQSVITPQNIASYEEIQRFVMRTQRAVVALSSLWTRLHDRQDEARRYRSGAAAMDRVGRNSSGLAQAHAWHVLRLHIHELRHFVSGVQTHFIAHVCDSCWSDLTSAIESATSPTELRAAHDAYLDAATTHCLLHPEGRACASLITSVLALALSLHREVSEQGDASFVNAIGEDGDGDNGASWVALVGASRRQFSLLLLELSKQPLAPRELLLPSVVLSDIDREW